MCYNDLQRLKYFQKNIKSNDIIHSNRLKNKKCLNIGHFSVKNMDNWMLDTRCWMLDTRCWMLDTGYGISFTLIANP